MGGGGGGGGFTLLSRVLSPTVQVSILLVSLSDFIMSTG